MVWRLCVAQTGSAAWFLPTSRLSSSVFLLRPLQGVIHTKSWVRKSASVVYIKLELMRQPTFVYEGLF